MNELATKGDERMTVQEISDSIGVPVRTIHDSIDRRFPGIKQNGKTTYLTKEQVSEISSDLKRAHTIDLADTRKVAITDIEMERMTLNVLEWHVAKVQTLQAENRCLAQQNTVMTPKAEFYDAVTGSPDTIDMKNVAKVLNMGIGRNKLFALLRGYKVLMNRNEPYQKYVDTGYFRIVESKFTLPSGDVGVNLKTVVYQKGVDFIRKLVQKSIDDGTIDKVEAIEE